MPAEDVTSSVAARVQSVLSAAEREAAALQREVEKTAELRATEILMDAEREAQRMLAEADDLARTHLEETRARLDAYAAGNYAKAADQYRKAYAHMFMTGDLLAGAIAKQKDLK